MFRVLNSHQEQSAYPGFGRICLQSAYPSLELIIYTEKILNLWGSTSCIAALIEAVLCIMHADDQMLEIYRVVGQMTLKSIICGIVHHAHQTRAYCPTMVSSFKLLLGIVCSPRFCRFYQCSNAWGRSPQILNFSLFI